MDAAGGWGRALIVAASALAIAALLYPFTAKPFSFSWDELVYMGLAFQPEPKAWRLNRYAHVYALLPFVRITGDPYVGARLFWSCSVGLTAAVLVRAALAEPAASRWLALALALLFFAGQEDVFDHPGIAYAEYTAMPAIAATFCLVWTRIARGGSLSGRDAAIAGLLTPFALKATELSVPMSALGGVLFLTPSGVRVDRTALRLAACWAGAMVIGALVIMALDLLFLGDGLFSLRPASWRELLGYNFPTTPDASPTYKELRWLLRPEIARALLLYAISGWLWIGIEPDARLRFLYALPLAFFAMLGLLEAAGRLAFVPRYAVPVLPLLSFLPAVALSRLAADAPVGYRRSAAVAFCAALGIGTAAIGGIPFLAATAGASADRIERIVIAGLIVAAAAVLAWSRSRPRLIAGIAVPVVAAAALFPFWRVATELAQRDAQRAGDAWFNGFYEVARATQVESDAVIFVSDRLYGGAIRPGVLPALTRMNFNLPLTYRQIGRGSAPGPDADYAVLSLDEWDAWRAAHAGDPPDVVVSTDRAVALVCLRAPCTRRRWRAPRRRRRRWGGRV